MHRCLLCLQVLGEGFLEKRSQVVWGLNAHGEFRDAIPRHQFISLYHPPSVGVDIHLLSSCSKMQMPVQDEKA